MSAGSWIPGESLWQVSRDPLTPGLILREPAHSADLRETPSLLAECPAGWSGCREKGVPIACEVCTVWLKD